MPVIQLYYPQGALGATHKADLAHRLTEVLVAMEGGARTPGGLAFATVVFTEVPQGDWWVGGKLDDSYVTAPGKFLARVSIPEGYMNQAHKSEVHASVNDAIVQALEGAPTPGLGANILVTIEEITEGNWGARGQSISIDNISKAVGLPQDGERFQWVHAYFEAKARQFAAAGYPADAGGLLHGKAVSPPHTF